MPSSQRALLDFFYRSFSDDIGLLSGRDLAGSGVSDAEPRIIFDLNGQKLFLDFTVLSRSGEPLGIFRSSARGPELPLIDSILIGKDWYDEAVAVKRAIDATQQGGYGSILQTQLVCYGYPRLGVMVACRSPDGKSRSFVYDAGSGALINSFTGPNARALSQRSTPQFDATVSAVTDQDEDATLEGIPFYSILSSRPEAGPAQTGSSRQWSSLQVAFNLSSSSVPDLVGVRRHSLKALGVDLPTQTVLPLRFAVRGSLLPATLFSQETEVFCAIATAEMMLSFVGITKTQSEIAKAMNVGPSGTTNKEFIKGLKDLSGGRLNPAYVNDPSFQDFVKAVEGMSPSKSGIQQHARLLRGWREYVFIDDKGKQISKEQFLIINDPYPVNSGQFVLENIMKPVDNFYTNIVTIDQS